MTSLGTPSPLSTAVLVAELLEHVDADLAVDVHALGRRLASGNLTVLVAGEAKRGKSTLTNALLGRPLLPCGVVPVTAFQTTVVPGQPERLEVDLADGSTQRLPLDQLPQYVTQRGNPGNRHGVREVRAVLAEGLPHPSLLLIDSPGFGSTVEDNSRQAAIALEQMDIAVLVLSADAPMSASEAALLSRLAELSVEVVVALNKIDLVEESQRDEVRAYVADAAAAELQRPVSVLLCSGRAALEARISGDGDAWRASGVDELHALLSIRADSRVEQILERSIAKRAGQLAARQLDRCNVQMSTMRSLREDRNQELNAFEASITETTRLGSAAIALLESALARHRSDLAHAAEQAVPRLRRRLRAELDDCLPSPAAGLAASELEAGARARIEDHLRIEVEQWRAEWQQRLSAELAAQRARATELLGQAVADLRISARENLGVELTTGVPEFDPPDFGALVYDASPDPGWNQAATAFVRHAGPGARKRTVRFLRQECSRLADKHVGRARAEMQRRLDEGGRQLRSALQRAFAESTQDLTQAQEAARILQAKSQRELYEAIASVTTRHRALLEIGQQLQQRTARLRKDDPVEAMRG